MTDALTIDRATFRAAVTDAIRAPSMYNEQPWRFRLVDGAIEVRIDPYRALPVADPSGWAARVACGAAVTNIRLRLAVLGIRTAVRIRPTGRDGDLAAHVSADGAVTPTPADRALCAAIPRRHSNRRPFADAPVPRAARARMQHVVEASGGWLALTDERHRVAQFADIIAAAERALRDDPGYVAEMRTWTGRAGGDPVGIPVHNAGVEPAGQDLLAMRDYGAPPRAPGRDFESDPLVAVLGTIDDRPDDDVAAGMMLQTLLLAATDERLAASMLSQPIEVPAYRRALGDATGRRGAAQMIVRIGYGQPTTATPRRPIDDVIDLS
ncbi:MAG TPA: nitroreductase [Micromonosporaceae bacterium]|nr:nitroreductase [Micromonosporaceae bacterium]